jgi:hypothetical protein
MTDDTNSNELINQTIALIPEHAWTQVRQVIITSLVDNMPGSVVEKLTGSYDNFERAEEVLYNYYELPDCKEELITDAFKIMGATNCLELLSSLNIE